MRAIIYARCSTVRQDNENQIAQLEEHAKRQGWELVEVVRDIASGSKSDNERHGLDRVFQLAHQRKFDVLLFWALDRLSREGCRQTLEYLTRLDKLGVKWHSYSEPYISSIGLFADAVVAILATLARQERLRIGERTKAGLERARLKGAKLGRPRVDERIKNKAVELRSTGMSFAKIGEELGVSKARAHQLCSGVKEGS